ncbi:MAG: DNA polymerase III subunit beta [Lachnospiraceae bacterium]|jgi:DNA polymerase-3 subunit beta|nr:DNA polymerase III subunit beta [Lachnospiraceae bacterium]MBQ5559638.1 DNA polymerase III subunit beta [Lachnospiraceae bacterium]
MQIICNKSDLLNSINIALRAVSTKTTLPILECVVIDATNGMIKLISNDQELGIETIVKGTIVEPGAIAIEAKLFADIIRKFPDSDVTFTSDENFMTLIQCEKSKFNLMGRSHEDFPMLPKVEMNQSIKISDYSLKEVIRQTIFSVSDNESNKIMTGELFEISGDTFKVVSLDGHRISIRKIQLHDSYDNIRVIVPGKTLNEIAKILSGEMDKIVNIYFTDKHILFSFDDTTVLSRLIEGEYYKIEQMLSANYETKVTVNNKELLNCIDRASLMIKDVDKNPIILNFENENLELKTNSTVGSMKEDLDIIKSGKDILIGFNPKFLMDALRVIDDETVDIYLFNPKAPCFIKDKDETYIYLILPINFNVA